MIQFSYGVIRKSPVQHPHKALLHQFSHFTGADHVFSRAGKIGRAVALIQHFADRADPAVPARDLLHRIYSAQVNHWRVNKRWARTFQELKLPRVTHDSFAGPPLLETVGENFEASVPVKMPDGSVTRWHIRQDSRIWRD